MQCIDLTYLKSISGDDEAFIKEMLSMFLNETVTDVLEIEQYVQSNACGQVAALAHKIKGPLQMLSAKSVELVTTIEDLGKQKAGGAQIAPFYNELKRMVMEDMTREARIYLDIAD